MAFDSESVCRVVLGVIVTSLAGIGLPARWRADRAGGRVSYAADPGWFWIFMSFVGPPVGLAVAAFLLNPRWVDFAAVEVPAGMRLTGAPVGLLGLGLFGWMFRHLGLNVTSTSIPRPAANLVTSGPYRWVRHPMYSAALILLVATTLLTANWVVAVGGSCAFALLVARSRLEERRLVEKFGDAYREYQRSTGRFLPRLNRSRAAIRQG